MGDVHKSIKISSTLFCGEHAAANPGIEALAPSGSADGICVHPEFFIPAIEQNFSTFMDVPYH
jgi:hypothetical protein